MPRPAARAMMVGAAIAALPNVTGAQEPCAAAVRELSRVTPRAVLHEASDSAMRYRPAAADGAWCAGTTGALVRRDLRPGPGLTIVTRVLPVTVEGAAVGGLPDPVRSGGTWMGRGGNFFVRPAASVDAGPVHLVLAPELWRAQNLAFDLFPSPDAARSSFAAPWYGAPWSIDLPSRMGVDPVMEAGPGQSALWVTAGPVEVGAATSSQQWGPGRHGGLVLGADAPGIPRVFARSTRPIATRAGDWSFTAFTGSLTESRFFDRDPSNDARALRAVNLSWRPGPASAFGVGFSHATMLGEAMTPGDTAPGGDSLPGEGRSRRVSDQINAVFAELRGAGTRGYVELGRAHRLPSLREFVTVPYAGIAYLVGVEHAIRHAGGAVLISAEAANLEQPTDVRGDSTFDFYTSRSIAQGWTHRGRVLGHPAGPGGMHAVLAVDWVTPRWSAGIFGDRVRWNEDALHREYLARSPRHDVSVRAGVRAGYLVGRHEVSLEASTGKRLNYLFQNAKFFTGYRTVDVSLPQLRLSITPRP